MNRRKFSLAGIVATVATILGIKAEADTGFRGLSWYSNSNLFEIPKGIVMQYDFLDEKTGEVLVTVHTSSAKRVHMMADTGWFKQPFRWSYREKMKPPVTRRHTALPGATIGTYDFNDESSEILASGDRWSATYQGKKYEIMKEDKG